MIIFYILITNCYPGGLNVGTHQGTWGRVLQCVLGVTISDSRKFEHECTSTHSEQRISTQMFVCMHFGSHLNEYDAIRMSHGNVLVIVYDISDISIEGI